MDDSTQTLNAFDENVFSFQNSMIEFETRDLRNIWKWIRGIYDENVGLESLCGSMPLLNFEPLTVGEFALLQLHNKKSKSNTTQICNDKIPKEEWWTIVQQHFETKQEMKTEPSAESEFPFHLFDNDDDGDDDVNDDEADADCKNNNCEIDKKNEKRMKRRHNRRLRNGLTASKEFPFLSLAQIRLYLHMIRELDSVPKNQIIAFNPNKNQFLSLQDFAIRYLFSKHIKLYKLKFVRLSGQSSLQ